MKLFRCAVLYTALALGANATLADTAALEALRDGSMKKLQFHDAPEAVTAATFTEADGTERTLADWQGKHIVLNFWATWCAPCRKEMPALDALQQEFGGDAFEVVTLATGRNKLAGITRFFEEESITALPVLLDPKQAVAREMAVLGLPITVIIDPEGREIARLRGDADWHSESARAIVAALIAPES
ncbi:MAG: TlpA disulfide reductase family protein [Pseudomonadota bacterium]